MRSIWIHVEPRFEFHEGQEPVHLTTQSLSKLPRIITEALPLNISKTLHAAFTHWKLSILPSEMDLAPNSDMDLALFLCLFFTGTPSNLMVVLSSHMVP